MSVDVVYVVYGAGHLTWLSLQHVLSTTPVNRVIMVDQAPDDLSLSHGRLAGLLQSPNILIENHEPIGAFTALNQALAETKTQHVLIASSDAFIGPGWFGPTMHMIEERGWGYAGPMEFNLDHYEADILWRFFLDHYPTSLIQGRSPSCFGLMDWHRLRDTIGGYDERFFLNYGDTDLIERMRDAGIAFGSLNPPRVLHLVQQQRRLLEPSRNAILEMWDEEAFRDKWRYRPDVLARHPVMGTYADKLAHQTQLHEAPRA